MATRRTGGPLRSGWTTGACAAAAAKAAFTGLTTGSFPNPVSIRLPRGEQPSFALAEAGLTDGGASAAIVKDAGDDPDVTHGALVRVTVTRLPTGSGVRFAAGPGVGTVTRPGLPVPVGEPAINPGPRQMITAALADVASDPDLCVTVSIPDGQRLAEKTLNGRLGIVGGLSILGTTGVVVPYSCAAWVHSIHRGIDVARASGLTHLAGATGSTSERAVQALYQLPDAALIDMGDLAGGLLKYLRRCPVPRLTIAGGPAKLAKLAEGRMDLHSGAGEADLDRLRLWLRAAGGDPGDANSVGQLLVAAGPLAGVLATQIAATARQVALAVLAGEVAVDVIVVDRSGGLIGRAGP
ncbi:MAG: cobalt-precorrin-5B (C(1))-methyltransferase [Alphaproteobacteria bacterium]|nr:cobalt-precorrin-5B (C(1))-methyltransferase [Alphaproteobacteria bacterium]